MLEPSESDVLVLFLVLVVLPLVAYVLLGKWIEATKNRDKITLFAHLAAEEALRAEEMAVADVIPTIFSSKGELHECARCSAPARTRCSKCKSVRYCSGNCQIIHWRQIHKQECQQLETHKSSSFPLAVSFDEFSHGSGLFNENLNPQFFSHSLKQTLKDSAKLDNVVHPSTGTGAFATADYALFNKSQVSTFERRTSNESNRETQTRYNGSIYESSGYKATSSPSSRVESKETFKRQKNVSGIGDHIYEQDESRSMMYEGDNYQCQNENAFVPRKNYESSSLSNASSNDESVDEFETGITTKGGNVIKGANHSSDEAAQYKCPSEMTIKISLKARKMSRPPKTKFSKSLKSKLMTSTDLCVLEMEKKGKIPDEPKVAGTRDTISSHGSNGTASIGIMKMMDLRKATKLTALATSGGSGDNFKKIKMSFPYEEFVKIFQGEVFGIFTRGLLNCGNSCYANAVLQCLTCTKPLVVYLICRSHSKSCTANDWCLMCELEQHIMILRENGAPLSPSRILCHMWNLNCRMADGNQEDAHEFLRLLIASMQSICLEELGGEIKVDPRLQETTFIQHTFGGRLQSKVKCLNCNHESETYENIMDLTLEIWGWVESLEDALSQFTSPEDLHGENMYKCERCIDYVPARKQLSIHEAPNILTIVLKRFQEGRYGKINKCITFPEMLDMIPFMTGTGDIPPHYMLYGVVVHLDTLNASFSGHYVSYVKDLQGNWFRIDDTEVQPVLISQVMSEGAYILFYMRSSPRPPVAHTGKAMTQQTAYSSKNYPIETQKQSKSGHSRHRSQFVVPEHSTDTRPEIATPLVDTSDGFLRSPNRNVLQVTETFPENVSREFSDATSSDWSLFTSSDEASFTTESTRDSFSTIDYGDSYNVDPISSIVNYMPGNYTNCLLQEVFTQ